MAPVAEAAQKRARPHPGPAVLAALINGAHLNEIAETHHLPPKRVERLIRDELRKRWIAPAQDHARLQIARLEPIAAKLKARANTGHLPSIDRLLKVLDRLDRYHGFTKLITLTKASDDNLREKLIVKLTQAAHATAGES